MNKLLMLNPHPLQKDIGILGLAVVCIAPCPGLSRNIPYSLPLMSRLSLHGEAQLVLSQWAVAAELACATLIIHSLRLTCFVMTVHPNAYTRTQMGAANRFGTRLGLAYNNLTLLAQPSEQVHDTAAVFTHLYATAYYGFVKQSLEQSIGLAGRAAAQPNRA